MIGCTGVRFVLVVAKYLYVRPVSCFLQTSSLLMEKLYIVQCSK